MQKVLHRTRWDHQGLVLVQVSGVDVPSTSEGRLVMGIDFLAVLSSGGTGGNSRMRLGFEALRPGRGKS